MIPSSGQARPCLCSRTHTRHRLPDGRCPLLSAPGQSQALPGWTQPQNPALRSLPGPEAREPLALGVPMAAEGGLLAGSVTRKAIIHAGPHLGISGGLATLEKQACQSPGSPGQRRAGATHGARLGETTQPGLGGWSIVGTTHGIAPTHLLWGQADGNGAEDGLLQPCQLQLSP